MSSLGKEWNGPYYFIWQRWGIDQTVEVSIKSQAQVHDQVHPHRLKSLCLLRTKPFYVATNDGSRTEANLILQSRAKLLSEAWPPSLLEEDTLYLSNSATKSTFLSGKSKKYIRMLKYLNTWRIR